MVLDTWWFWSPASSPLRPVTGEHSPHLAFTWPLTKWFVSGPFHQCRKRLLWWGSVHRPSWSSGLKQLNWRLTEVKWSTTSSHTHTTLIHTIFIKNQAPMWSFFYRPSLCQLFDSGQSRVIPYLQISFSRVMTVKESCARHINQSLRKAWIMGALWCA